MGPVRRLQALLGHHLGDPHRECSPFFERRLSLHPFQRTFYREGMVHNEGGSWRCKAEA
jgi:hypothetical protein